MPTNDYLPFCPTDTGTNLESQATYLAGTDRNTGNQPGIASLELNNKALRQGTFIAGELAQFVSDTTGTDTLDNGVQAQFLSQLKAALQHFPPTYTSYLTGSGTHNPTYYFFVASGNATTAATYTNNSITFTVVTTISAGTLLRATGGGAPSVSGTLTKTSGTGDATIAFYAVRAPTSISVDALGGGGGGAGSGTTNGTAATAGASSTFSTRTAGGGSFGTRGIGGAGGAASGSGFTTLVAISGGAGNGPGINTTSATGVQLPGGVGGMGYYGGGGGGGGAGNSGGDGAANSGSGGSGGGNDNVAGEISGGGGGAGAFLRFSISAPFTNYAYSVGTGGAAGAAGTSGRAGGNGAVGQILVTEF